MKIGAKTFTRGNEITMTTPRQYFEKHGFVRMHEPCNCGARIAHNNGGNYHEITTVVRSDMPESPAYDVVLDVLVQYHDTCQLTEQDAEWYPRNSEEVFEGKEGWEIEPFLPIDDFRPKGFGLGFDRAAQLAIIQEGSILGSTTLRLYGPQGELISETPSRSDAHAGAWMMEMERAWKKGARFFKVS